MAIATVRLSLGEVLLLAPTIDVDQTSAAFTALATSDVEGTIAVSSTAIERAPEGALGAGLRSVRDALNRAVDQRTSLGSNFLTKTPADLAKSMTLEQFATLSAFEQQQVVDKVLTAPTTQQIAFADRVLSNAILSLCQLHAQTDDVRHILAETADVYAAQLQKFSPAIVARALKDSGDVWYPKLKESRASNLVDRVLEGGDTQLIIASLPRVSEEKYDLGALHYAVTSLNLRPRDAARAALRLQNGDLGDQATALDLLTSVDTIRQLSPDELFSLKVGLSPDLSSSAGKIIKAMVRNVIAPPDTAGTDWFASIHHGAVETAQSELRYLRAWQNVAWLLEGICAAKGNDLQKYRAALSIDQRKVLQRNHDIMQKQMNDVFEAVDRASLNN